MPIYEFVCEACGRLEERLQKLSDPPPEACPECGAKMAKIMSRNSFQLKGGGWYKDLYSGVSAAAAKPAPATPPGDGGAAKPASPGAESKAGSPAPAAGATPAATPAASAPKPAAT